VDEQALVQQAAQGDTKAFGELVQRYQHALVAGARHLTRSEADAEDLAQDALIDAYRKLPTLKDAGKFRAWLYGILRHKCLDALRRQRRADLPLDDYAEVLPAPLPQEPSELAALLATLPLADRDVLIGRYLQGLEYHELAMALGTNEKTARKRVSRARAKLRQLANEQDAQLQAVMAGLLIFPLDTFTGRVLTEVNTMTQLSSATMTATAASTMPTLSLPAFISSTVGKVTLGLVLALGIGGGYYAAGTRGQVPLPTGMGGVTTTASTMSENESAFARGMQVVLDKLVAWSKQHNGQLPSHETWARDIGVTPTQLQVPTMGGLRYTYAVPSGVKTVRELEQMLKQQSAELLNKTGDRIPLLYITTEAGGAVSTTDNRMVVGFADGSIDVVTLPQPTKQSSEISEPDMQCIGNLRTLVVAVLQNIDSKSVRFPTAAAWQQVVNSDPKLKALACPAGSPGSSYVYNNAIAGMRQADMTNPADVVVLYEAKDGKPDFRHDGKIMIAFADGHIARMTWNGFSQLNVK